MKTLYRLPITLLAALLLTVGCGKDTMDFTSPEVPEDEMGYLQLSEMSLGVATDAETISAPIRPTSAPSLVTKRDTRTPEPAGDDYLLAIVNSYDETVWSGTYGSIKAMTEPLALQPGFYTMTAKSSEQIPVVGKNPTYDGSAGFEIVKKEMTLVPTLVCTLSNIKATVDVSVDLKALFKDDEETPMKVTIAVQGGGSCELLRDDNTTVYFQPIETSNSIIVTISGLYNIKGEGETPEYQFLTMDSQPIENVKAGQWRKIAIAVEHTDEGNAQLIVTVETWVYDDQIDVDTMSKSYVFGEDEVRDNDEGVSDADAPQLSFDGSHSLNDPFVVSGGSFDPDLNICTNRIQLSSMPQGTASIAKAWCVFDSDNAEFLTALAEAGYTKNKLDIYPANGVQDLLIVRTDEMNRLVMKANDAAMYGIYRYPGMHTAQIVVEDNQKRRSYTTMTIVVMKDAQIVPPTIRGIDGFDPSVRHTLTPGQPMKVAISVTSQTGITGFIIEILGGDILTDDELESLSLASRMDLLNPATPEMKKQLQGLGFLPADGSSVKGKKNMTFDISEFMPAMSGLGRTGNCDFRLTITDAAGTETASLMFTIE